MSNSSHVDLPPSYSPNLSASGSPTKMHEAFGDFTKNSSGGGDTLSVKSAAILDHPSHYSEHTSAGDLASANLSASNPNLDQAGQKASWPALTPRSLRKFAAISKSGIKFVQMLNTNSKQHESSTTTVSKE